MNDQKKPTSSTSKASRVPAALGSGLDAEIDRIIDQAQAEGLQLTGQGGLLGGMIKKAVESAMNAEMTAHLGYERYAAEGRGSGNSRNGTSTSTVHTNAGPVELDKPRDRNGSFDSKVVPKGTRRLSEFDDMVLSLFAKGMATRDIAEHLEITYGADVSHETIANITDAINDTVKDWRNRPLEEGRFLGSVANAAGRNRNAPLGVEQGAGRHKTALL